MEDDVTPIEVMHANRELYLGTLRFVRNLAARRGLSLTEAATLLSEAAALVGVRCEAGD